MEMGVCGARSFQANLSMDSSYGSLNWCFRASKGFGLVKKPWCQFGTTTSPIELLSFGLVEKPWCQFGTITSPIELLRLYFKCMNIISVDLLACI
ncbi:hypothetical protein V6Z12_D03G075700 [Gossypium hirsutum]